MPVITEVLMAPGSFSVPFRRSAELEALLSYYQHLQFWWGEELIAQGPYLRRVPQGGILSVEGALMPWWLGVDNEGPLVELARYRSGASKLSNGGFELGELYWRTVEGSSWVIPSPSGIGGGSGVRTSGDYGRDDVLEYAEDFEVFPGDVLTARMLAQHFTSNTGRVHLRVTYDGLFNQPNLAPPLQGGGYWASPEPTSIVSGVSSGGRTNPAAIKMGPTPKVQFLQNNGFEAGTGTTSVDDWTMGANTARDSGTVYKGSWSVVLGAGNASISQVVGTDIVHPDDEITFSCWAAPTNPVDFDLLVRFKYFDTDGLQQFLTIGEIHSPNATGWRHYQFDFTVPSDFDSSFNTFSLIIESSGPSTSGEHWNIDEVYLWRVRGNTAELKTFNVEAFDPANRDDYLAVIPEEEYEFTVWVRSDAGTNHGNIWLRVVTRFDHVDGPEEIIEGEVRSITKNHWHRIGVRFTPSSGFVFALLDIVVQDVYGGSFYVDDPVCRVTDKRKRIANLGITPATAPGPSPHVVTFDTTVPTGARTASVSVIAERDGNGWQVDDVSLTLKGTPHNAEDVVAGLVSLTGLSPGAIVPYGPINFDWVVRNRMVRQAVDEISTQGLVTPPREWRCNPGGTFDWGEPADIFADRTNVVFVEGESWLIQDPNAVRSMEQFAKRVKVVGAERNPIRGAPFIVTATADNGVGDYKRFDGSPFDRTRLEENGAVDTQPYAAALARDIADRLAVEQESYEIGVADWRTLGKFDVGDWTYLFHPTEGITDPTRPVMWEGRTVYPRRLRAISRTWTLGSGPFRIVLRTPLDSQTSYLRINGAGWVETPNHSSLDILGDLDMRAALALDDWTPGTTMVFVRKYEGTTSQSSYQFVLNATGNLELDISTTGSNLAVQAISSVPPAVSDGALLLVRVTFDADNGAGGNDTKFYTKASTPANAAADRASDTGWTQLGTTQTHSGTITIFNSNQPLTIGATTLGVAGARGNVYAATVKNGINGTTVADPDFTSQDPGVTGFTDSSGRLWSLRGDALISAAANAEEIDVSEFVEWPKETKATVEVGDRRPEFISNPQGGAASKQYMRFRTSRRDG